MTNRVGVWIDHKKAVIVLVSEQGESVKKIESGAQHIEFRAGGRRRSADGAQYAQGEDQLDNQFMEQLKKYYDQVAILLRGATSILIFGPGEAKTELKTRLAREKGVSREIQLESATSRVTDRQIVARVRKFYGSVPSRK